MQFKRFASVSYAWNNMCTVKTHFSNHSGGKNIPQMHINCTTEKMTTLNANQNEEDDTESLLSHNFGPANSKLPNTQVREVVKENVFPVAKFLRSEDTLYSMESKSWCQKMATWCHIEPQNLQLWWQQTKKTFLQELQHQRANKTNVVKREFFGK